MIPLAPAIVFGIIAHLSGGTVALPYFIGFLCMIFTVYSFIYMVKKYPYAGSVYTYVTKTFGNYIGFLSGWALVLDYLLSPAITTASAAFYLKQLIPNSSFLFLVLIFIAITGFIAILGVKIVSRTGLVILIAGEFAVFSSFLIWGDAIHNGLGVGKAISSVPFYFENIRSLFGATSVAVLSYMGFDAISTLSEEAKNPKRNIPLAMILALIIGACTMIITGYIGVLAQPDNSLYNTKIWQNTSLFLISKMTGGEIYSLMYGSVFVVSMAYLNVVATTAVSRLIFAMSRDGKLPRLFSIISKKYNTPYIAILLILLIEAIIVFSLNLELLSELISFGALFAFITLNIAVFKDILYRHSFNKLKIIFPIIGTTILCLILINMDAKAIYCGLVWFFIGILILIFNNNFKKKFI